MKLFKNIFVALAVIILAAGVAGASIMIVRNMEGSKSSQPASTSTNTSRSSSSSSSGSSSITPPTSSTSSGSSSSSSSSSSSQSSSSSEPVPYIDEPGVLSTATSDASFRYFGEDSQQWFSAGQFVPYTYSLDSEDSSKIVFANESSLVVRCDHPVSITTSYRYFCIDYSRYDTVPASTDQLSDTAIIRFEVTTNKTFNNVSLKGCFIDFKVNLNAYGWMTRNIIFDLENDGQCSFIGSSGPSTSSEQVSINFGNRSYTPAQWNTFLISNNINLSLMDCIAMSDIYSMILQPKVKQTFNVDGLYFSNETIE